jgi:hypothetical protein
MIIRRFPSSQQLIAQPAHAALAARIMSNWQAGGLPGSPNRASILHAIEHHDDGWAEIDEALVVDESTGQLMDFIELPDAMKRDTSLRGIDRLTSDPYAAALVAQHRLHVYKRYADHPDWRPFFTAVTAARDAHLAASGGGPLDGLLRDYLVVRAGDLVSLAFCNNWKNVAADECGHAMRLEGTSLIVTPDPFGGRSIEFAINAREIGVQGFASAAEARRLVAAAPIVSLQGVVTGS